MVGYNDEVIDAKFLLPFDNRDRIVVATNSDQVRIFDLSTFNCQTLIGHTNVVLAVDVIPRLDLIVTSSKDNTVRVWDGTTLECLAVGVGHTEAVGAVAIAPRNCKFMASGSSDLTIKVWDIEPLKQSLINGKFAKRRQRYLETGKRHVMGSVPTLTMQDGETDDEFLDAMEPMALHALFTVKAHDKDINTIAVSPNDKLIATGSQDRSIRLYNKESSQLVGVLKGHKRGVWSVEFSPVDKVLVSGSSDRSIKLWSLDDFSCLRTFEGHTNSVLKVGFLTAGMQLVSSGSDGLLKLWTIKTNECIQTIDCHEDKVWALATTEDGNKLVTGASDSCIKLWKDTTIEVEQQAVAEEEEILLKQQDLDNLLRKKDFKRAIVLALELEQPYRTLKVFIEIMEVDRRNSLKWLNHFDEIQSFDMVDILTGVGLKEYGGQSSSSKSNSDDTMDTEQPKQSEQSGAAGLSTKIKYVPTTSRTTSQPLPHSPFSLSLSFAMLDDVITSLSLQHSKFFQPSILHQPTQFSLTQHFFPSQIMPEIHS
eukprot:TRINITY_DN1618_c0_g2_i2.p1 TRINITY_DN1618_c0_g2~~TRINITY_DN1618_c0_g2_i2.p1  ORF type:complete len:537 (+),score=188.36 TRINITY_DN1618_c0_g2_i2:1312-2922(+)